MSYASYDFDFEDVDDLTRQASALLRMEEDAQALHDQLGDEVENMTRSQNALEDHIDTARDYMSQLEDKFDVS